LIGPSETGKTTVLKQLKLLYGRKGLDVERQTYRRVVHLNVMKAIQGLVEGMEQANIQLGNPENAVHVETVRPETDMFADMVPAIKSLWADSGIQKTFDTCTQLSIQDSAKYFLDAVDRVAHPEYIPTDDDILQARVRTLAVSEHIFDIDGVAYRIYDVGGQKSLRKYWVPYFDEVDAIIFMSAISAYDQGCEDNPNLNRLQDCLLLFNEISNHKLFLNTSMIVFLNKIDIFQRKLLSGSMVNRYFPDYNGPNDYFSTTVFFQYRFLEQCKDLQKQVYTHFTHATDTKQMKVIVVAVNVIIQRLNLRNSGLL
ncbi:MAG: guanine nucleotide-binding protein subunit alpha, partial [Linnemannia elongata]